MSIWFLYICRLALAILMYCKKIAIATSSYNSYWTAIWVKRNTEWSNERAYTMKKTTHKFNTYHDGLSYIHFTFGPRAFCAVCKCVYVALTKVHFPPTLWFNFLCCQPKTTASLSLSSHATSSIVQPNRNNNEYTAPGTNNNGSSTSGNKKWKRKREDRREFHNSTWTTKTHPRAAHVMCARKTLVLFIFWCYFLLFRMCMLLLLLMLLFFCISNSF